MKTGDLIKRLAVLGVGGAFVFGAVAAQVSSSPKATPPADDQAADDPAGATTQPEALELPPQFAALRAAMQGGGGGDHQGSGDELPKFEEVSKGYRQVISTADGASSLYNVWVRDKDGQMLAELPRGYERQFHFMAMTVAGGDLWAGLQSGDRYFYWKRYDKRMALIAPNLGTRTSGDQESHASVENIFTDSVILDVPIVAIGPSGQPVIDLDELLVGNAGTFFGRDAAGLNPRLTEVKSAKAFPQNVEIGVEGPVASGELREFHYSISVIPENSGYKPRKADGRVGYFTTSYLDLGKFNNDDKWVRYINRWKLEKADPKLAMSPPKEPIVFYIEHTVPVRYRRWVRDGILKWNKAFEKVGIANAIEVYYQDQTTGAHMDKDPEDRRYNFIRWLSNDISTAIGPSRVDPRTGQILDADVVLTDGWIRAFWYQYNKTLPDIAMEGFSPDTMAWLDANPNWDPRIRMAPPGLRDSMLADRARRGVLAYGGHPIASGDTELMGDNEYDGLTGRVSQLNGMCMASTGKAMDLAIARMTWDMFHEIGLDKQDLQQASDAEQGPPEGQPQIPPEILEILKKKFADGQLPDNLPPEILAMLRPAAPDAPAPAPTAPAAQPETPAPAPAEGGDKPVDDLLDGVPEWYIGPMVSELVAHEVGHTLGLRHNFAGTSAYSMKQINSEEFKGKKPWSLFVMDYNPHNINMDPNEIQGDYAVIDIGPYDFWAIDYGYTASDKDAAKLAGESADPMHRYLTDEDTWGPDPYARRYDMGSDTLTYAKEQIKLAEELRSKLLDRFVKEGDSWAKARQGYMVTLGMQTKAESMMANWLGASFVYRDHKGDKDGRAPIADVAPDAQREALKFVIDTSFYDKAFGLTPDVLHHITVDKWLDEGGVQEAIEDPTWPMHDRILGVQAAALTMILDPMVLQRVYDNEARIPSDQDALTLAELLDTVTAAAFSEVSGTPDKKYTAREPMISSLRRNLQREYLDRLVDLSVAGKDGNAAFRPISDLATHTLRKLSARMGSLVESSGAKNVDPYTLSHLTECKARVDRVLDAAYIYNASDMRSDMSMPSFPGFGQPGGK
ncbi:MAG: zinc-dependent metalloprotease [Phycisphaerales bacterium]|nr:zinc-dependent metalloprotease [Phycisphaerales bacterium]